MKNDIRSLDLNLLKALDALLDEGSVTRAAQRLSLTATGCQRNAYPLARFF